MGNSNGYEVYRRMYVLVFALYVGFGPIYWLPLVSAELIQNFKTVLFFALVLLPFLNRVNTTRFVFIGGSSVFFVFAAFYALFFASLVSGNMVDEQIYSLQNMIQILLLYYSLGHLLKLGLLENMVRLAFRVFVFFSGLCLLLFIFAPSTSSTLDPSMKVVATGFGGSRTGWSPAVALYLPWAYASGIAFRYFSYLIVLILLGNQIIIAGRAGLLASYLAFLCWSVLRANLKVFIVSGFLLGAAVYLAMNNLEVLRLDRGGVGGIQELNELSTGRVNQYFIAFSAISEKPFLGHGVGLLFYNGSLHYIHNEYLRLAVEGGLLYLSLFITLVCLALYRVRRRVYSGDKFAMASFLTVIVGLVIALFEPRFIFGSFHNSVFWWVCLSVCLASNRS